MTKKISFEHDRADSSALVSELASVIAHDVRTPVRHIGQFLEFYQRELEAGNTAQAAEHLQIVKESVALVSDMLDGVVTYARLGRGLDEPCEVNLHKLAETAFSRACLALGRENVELILEGDPMAFGHDVRLQEMFVHLFENAMVHSGDVEKLIIRVASYQGEASTHIEVRDNGVGVPEGYDTIVFDLFQKGRKTKEVSSVGIGLSLARRIARLHGGDLVLERQTSSSGAERPGLFVITLPKQ